MQNCAGPVPLLKNAVVQASLIIMHYTVPNEIIKIANPPFPKADAQNLNLSGSDSSGDEFSVKLVKKWVGGRFITLSKDQ